MHFLFAIVIGLAVISRRVVNGERGALEGCYNENLYLYKSQVVAATVDECVDACAQLFFR